MNNLKNYLKISSVLVIFSEAAKIHYLIDIKLLYPVLFFNTAILIYINRYKLTPANIFLLVAILFHGIISFAYLKIPFRLFISQFIGITLVSTYFYNVLKYIGIEEMFEYYVKIAFYVSILGLIMYLLDISIWDKERLHSILPEPSFYIYLTVPATIYFYKTKSFIKLGIMLISLILAKSSLGYFAVILYFGMEFIGLKQLKYSLLSLPLIILFVIFLSKNEEVMLRFNDTADSINIFKNKKLNESINISSYALLSNTYVSVTNFIQHPFGTGLGSYTYIYDEIIKEIKIPKYIKTLKLDRINNQDADSLLLRMLSDFGVFGIVLILYILTVYYRPFKTDNVYNIIANGIFIYLILKLIRSGHYFSVEFYFFLWTYILVKKEAINES